jgi:hypothetical protein
LRIEHGLSYSDVAEHLGMCSASAARMAITRAIRRLGLTMKRVGQSYRSNAAAQYRTTAIGPPASGETMRRRGCRRDFAE